MIYHKQVDSLCQLVVAFAHIFLKSYLKYPIFAVSFPSRTRINVSLKLLESIGMLVYVCTASTRSTIESKKLILKVLYFRRETFDSGNKCVQHNKDQAYPVITISYGFFH